jgi:hypothetical protein
MLGLFCSMANPTNGVNTDTTRVNNINNEINNNNTMTLASFPTKNEIIAIREKMQISSLLELIRDKMYNSTTTFITLSMNDLVPFTGVMDKVFRSLMTEKEFTVIRTETVNNNEVGAAGYFYKISW